MGLTFTKELSIACCMHARSTPKCFYFQTSVISKAIQCVVFLHIAHFLQGITLQRLSGLRDVFMASDIVQTDHFKALAKDLSYLGEFMGVVGSKYQFHYE